jgi:hypothetical protein
MIIERFDLKAELVASRRVIGLDGASHICEAQAYRVHVCVGGWIMNEVLYNRRKFPRELQYYLWNKINCVIQCALTAEQFGETKAFRDFCRDQMINRYGEAAVLAYLRDGPNKIKTL